MPGVTELLQPAIRKGGGKGIFSRPINARRFGVPDPS
jgi:hypothetical protein